MTDRTPYSIPKEPGRWRAITLAAAVHAALVAFLWIGVHWQSQVPVAVEAEIWNPNVREAAPKPPPPEPTPTPEPIEKPTPQPEPKPVVREAPPPPKVVEPILPDPEIALEKERKRKAQEQKDQDRAEQAREDKERQRKADEQERKDQQKKDAEKLAEKTAEKQKALADAKKKADAEEKKAAEAADKLKAKQDAVKKEKDKIAADKAHQADAAAADKRHNDDMKRLQGQASGTGAANSTGTAAQSQGPRGDPGYAQKVGNRIKGNINFGVPDGMTGNPAVEFEVQLLPDGSVAGIQLRKSSGVSGFDEAVKRAIEKSAPYPKDKSGSVPSSFIGIHKPKDQ
ncbi:cell envelope integrity protein TolA [Glaciimonas sp. PCH181]|uniref:cell envelope integrity protein TolA n=1 Tax=Glaciimonas sp. PCH181 TaxID=2133943 RepID=UPI000D33F8D4|nr:cell envelope integrity protein TolA [Glaciimonas sp. PCH181]PUA16972.1 cell envelope integrity protein TolA [Glaciimonas sp. PCH181]